MTLQLISAGRVRLVGAGRGAAHGPLAAPVSVAPGIAPLSDVLFYQPEPAHPAQDYQSMIGHFVPVGGIGPFTYALGTTPNSSNYLLVNSNFIRAFGPPIGTTPDTLLVTVTDALGASITRTLPVLKKPSSAPALMLLRNSYEFCNTAAGSNATFDQSWSIRAFGGDHTGNDATTFSGAGAAAFSASGHDLGPLYGGGSTAPVPVGIYPLTLTSASATETLTSTVTITVPAPPAVSPMMFQPLPVSSTAPPGVLLGRALATTPTNGRAWSLSGPDAPLFAIDRDTGDVSVAATLSVGTKHVTLTCTDKAVSGSLSVAIPVAQGVLLPSANMTMAVNPALDNAALTQSVGMPAVSGMSGPVRWALNFLEFTKGIYGPILPLFQINNATGAITAPTTLSASTPYQLVVIATDGVRSCTRTFTVPVAAKAGPTLYVGQGMAAAHPGAGFEHLSDVMPLFRAQNLGANAGATVLVYENSDRNYYANDNANSPNVGLFGPVTFRGVSARGARVRVGGVEGSPNGGIDPSFKGFFVLATGDVTIDNFEISYVAGPDGTSGASIAGIRKNADCCGDLTVTNCDIHDCPDGVLTGSGPSRVFLRNTRLANTGTVFNPSTHGAYIGACVELVVDNCLSLNTNSGHNIKTRARRGTITNSRFYDGERGSASCQIDIPQGGIYTVNACRFHHGPNATNPHSVQFAAEEIFYPLDLRTNSLTVSNSTISMEMMGGTGNGNGIAVAQWGIASPMDGSPSVVTLTGNSFYLAGGATKYADTQASTGVGQLVETGSVLLTAAPALDFSDPGTATPPAARPGWLNDCTESGASYQNFSHVQIDPGFDDIRIPSGTAAGFVVANCAGYGATFYAQYAAADPRINPFATGAAWQVTQDPEEFGQSWAPVGRYVMNAATGQVTLGQALPSATGTDFFKVRVTSADGATRCDRRIKVSIV